MSTPNKRRMKLAEMREQAIESIGMDPGFELELDDGTTVTVPNPMLIPDDVQAALNAAGTDSIAMALAVLGEDDHARLIAGGGTSNDVVLVWRLMSKDIADKGPKLPR